MLTFWDIQVNAVKCLGKLGVNFDLLDRVAIFKIWLHLNRLELDLSVDREELADARDALRGIMLFRNEGMEPRHEAGRYVSQ